MRVNILLPLPKEWSEDAAVFGSGELLIPPPAIDMGLVRAILSALDQDGAVANAQPAAPAGFAERLLVEDLGVKPQEHEAATLIAEIGVLTVEVPSVQFAEERLQALNSDLRFEESRYRMVLSETDETKLPGERERPDSRRKLLMTSEDSVRLPWHVKRVRAHKAWALGCEGKGVSIAIIDTGVWPNCDLPRPLRARSFVPGVTSASDDVGHGTAVASVCLATGANRGVVGIAPSADLYVAKVIDACGGAETTWMAKGIVWAANQGADVINMSFGDEKSRCLDRAIRYAYWCGAVMCAAAGNHDPSGGCAPVLFPASSPLCIAVAGLDQDNRHIASSNCGPELAVAAPGVDVACTFPKNEVRMGGGTSAASPHAAGVAALMLSCRRISARQVKECMRSTALPLKPADKFGAGLLRADRAIACAQALP